MWGVGLEEEGFGSGQRLHGFLNALDVAVLAQLESIGGNGAVSHAEIQAAALGQLQLYSAALPALVVAGLGRGSALVGLVALLLELLGFRESGVLALFVRSRERVTLFLKKVPLLAELFQLPPR